MLGWDVGTFEFTSNRILALGYNHHAKLKMHTGGSSGRIPRTQATKLPEGDGYYWDLVRKDHKNAVRLPVKYRYRSPIVFEFHVTGHRKADAYATIWLQHLVDNEETPINIPIWKTSNPERIIQNYITEDNCRQEPGLEDLEEVGRLQFRARFKAGMDESHEAFISDNDSRETFETWEACFAEGVRTRRVEKEVPETVQQLHEESLTQGRDVLESAEEEEKKRWLSRNGADWSGAFGHDPKAYMQNGKKRREPGAEEPIHDPHHPSSDEHDDDDDYDDSESSSDLGIQDGGNTSFPGQMNGQAEGGGASGQAKNAPEDGSIDDQNKRTEQRKHRGLMQWKPVRNAKFAKDEGKIGLRKLKNKLTGKMEGRQPGVETGEFCVLCLRCLPVPGLYCALWSIELTVTFLL